MTIFNVNMRTPPHHHHHYHHHHHHRHPPHPHRTTSLLTPLSTSYLHALSPFSGETHTYTTVDSLLSSAQRQEVWLCHTSYTSRSSSNALYLPGQTPREYLRLVAYHHAFSFPSGALDPVYPLQYTPLNSLPTYRIFWNFVTTIYDSGSI